MRPFSWDYAGTSGRAAPSKRITRSDTVVCKMLKNVLCEVVRPWEQQIPKAVSDNRRGKARKIPALRDTDVFWPWPLIRRDCLQPVWKQQILFRIFRRRAARRIEKMRYLATRSSNTLNGSSNLVYDFSCFMCVYCMM